MTYDFSTCTERALKERLRYLSDKMDSLWIAIEPMIDEFNLNKIEFLDLVKEMNSRGLTNETQQQDKS